MPKCCPHCWKYYMCDRRNECCSECEYYSNGECLYGEEDYDEFEEPY